MAVCCTAQLSHGTRPYRTFAGTYVLLDGRHEGAPLLTPSIRFADIYCLTSARYHALKGGYVNSYRITNCTVFVATDVSGLLPRITSCTSSSSPRQRIGFRAPSTLVRYHLARTYGIFLVYPYYRHYTPHNVLSKKTHITF